MVCLISCILFFIWTVLVIGFTSVFINYNVRSTLQKRLFFPHYTATLLADGLCYNQDDTWDEITEMGIGLTIDDLGGKILKPFDKK